MLKSNRAAVSKKLRETVDQRLERSGILVSNAAKVRAPVDSGRLRASIQYIKEGNSVIIGTNVNYAVHQEFGTRFQSGTPFLRPGLNDSRPALKGLWKAPIDE